MAAAAVYGGMKGGKLGVEEAHELQLNRIRITLSSKNVKNLEKGKPAGKTPHHSFDSISWTALNWAIGPVALLCLYRDTPTVSQCKSF